MAKKKTLTSRLAGAAASLLLLSACGSDPQPNPETQKTAPVGTQPTNLINSGPREAKDEHNIFSLVDNRLLAHAYRNGALIAMPGSPGFAKYMRFGRPRTWKIHQKQDDRFVGLPELYASFDLPLNEAQAKNTKTIFVRIKSAGAKLIDVKLSAVKIGTINLAAGDWQTVQLDIPAGKLKAGENSFQFAINGKAAIEWIQLGGTPQDAAPTVFDPKERAFVFPKGDSLSYYVQVPKSGRFIGDVTGEASCELAVHAEAGDGAKADGVLKGQGAVDLSSLAGKIVRLDITGQGCDQSLLKEPYLTVGGPAPKVDKSKKPKNVVLWVMDSLRADRIKPIFADARPDVPNFEGLSKTAAFFRNSYSQGNESRASHSSIWSSQYPVNHGMIKDGAHLADSWTTIDEVMKAANFYTVGVSANGYITSKWGFGTKWDSYRNHIHDGGGLKGADVMSFAVKNLEGKTDKPFFLYMGMIDTHVSWTAREPWFSKYVGNAPYSGKYVKQLSGIDADASASGKVSFTAEDKKRIVAMYDSCVSYQDDLIGKFMEQLKTWGDADNTMIIITADHGDEQWEDGRLGHGSSQHETLIRVPLVIYYPPLFPGGMIDEGGDAGVDIVPTIADAIGAEIPTEAQGESLIPLSQGVGRGYPRPTFSSQYELAYSMLMSGWKLRVAGANVSLNFVDEDHLEQKNLAAEKPIELRFMTDSLSTFLINQKQWKKWKWGVVSNALPAFADDMEK